MITLEMVLLKMFDHTKKMHQLGDDFMEQEGVVFQKRTSYKEMETRSLLQENGPINGKNEQIRAAQLYDRLTPERLDKEQAERELAYLKFEFEKESGLATYYAKVAELMAILQKTELDINIEE